MFTYGENSVVVSHCLVQMTSKNGPARTSKGVDEDQLPTLALRAVFAEYTKLTENPSL